MPKKMPLCLRVPSPTPEALLMDRIRLQGGARSQGEIAFLASWIVAGVVARRDGHEAIAAIDAHIDAIYAVTRGILSPTDKATLQTCYARRTQFQNAVPSEWIEDLPKELPEELRQETGHPASVSLTDVPPIRYIDPNVYPGAWRAHWRQCVGLEVPESRKAIDASRYLTDTEYARYVQYLEGATS